MTMAIVLGRGEERAGRRAQALGGEAWREAGRRESMALGRSSSVASWAN